MPAMKKTLYSLMLDDDVVREVDALAHRRGVSRSGLINEILADYVEVMTPERWINDVFQSVEQLLSASRELVPFVVPNAMSMSVKSSLAYKYRPTVKYEVEFHRPDNTGSGSLSVVFRTQSSALIQAMTRFFRLWKQTEDNWFARRGEPPRQYALYDGRFVRSIVVDRPETGDDAARAIVDYVQNFDQLMKAYLADERTAGQLPEAYAAAMARQSVIL